jgi:hypothetical protein
MKLDGGEINIDKIILLEFFYSFYTELHIIITLLHYIRQMAQSGL